MPTAADHRFRRMLSGLRARGCRATPQRLAILRVIAESSGHPTAEGIHAQIREQLPTTSLATVYKLIATLKEMGEVLELEFSDGSNRYDGRNPGPHPHLICVRCRSIVDPVAPQVDPLSQEIARSAGYRLVSHRFDLYGVCPTCAERDDGG